MGDFAVIFCFHYARSFWTTKHVWQELFLMFRNPYDDKSHSYYPSEECVGNNKADKTVILFVDIVPISCFANSCTNSTGKTSILSRIFPLGIVKLILLTRATLGGQRLIWESKETLVTASFRNFCL